jgi:cell wall-associated NlpC family hydrolase
MAAMKFLETPYEWGGEDDQGIDCSGLVIEALREVFVVPVKDRTAADLYQACFASTDLQDNHQIIPPLTLYFRQASGSIGYKIEHVGIPIIRDMVIHASGTAKKVEIITFSEIDAHFNMLGVLDLNQVLS